MDNQEHRARAAAALRRFLDKPSRKTRPYPGYSRELLKTMTPEEAVERIMADAREPEPSAAEVILDFKERLAQAKKGEG